MAVEDTFPEPLVYEPTSGIHKHTVILLHGRGGSADTFGPALLNTALPPPAGDGVSGKLPNPDRPTTLAHALPHTRFVFPTAPKHRATVYKRSIIRQWFDDWHLGFAADEVDSRYDLGLQTTGIGRTVAYLHGLIAREAEVVGGTRNIILGGISQGCAVSLVASLLWEGEDGLGGVVGMCGWLPYISQMRGQLLDGEGDKVRISASGNDQEDEAGFDPFDRSGPPDCVVESSGGIDPGGSVTAALEWLRAEIEMPRRRPTALGVPRSTTPVTMSHGRDDEKVEITKGKEAVDFLPALGMGPVRFREYAGVGHEFSAEMLFDIADFIQDCTLQALELELTPQVLDQRPGHFC
ncbi:Alpha/Beta hydrolase protein [Diaporthe sp. PMI_573]|nr:Alpha/Beta hydrolase protein [Diaporthaceae sp. PMI_573]